MLGEPGDRHSSRDLRVSSPGDKLRAGAECELERAARREAGTDSWIGDLLWGVLGMFCFS